MLKANNNQTRAIWVATIVAVLALLVSVLSLYEAHEARIAAVRDNITIRASLYPGDYPLEIRAAGEGTPFETVDAFWEILISNIGSGTTSVTGYELLQVSQNVRFYTGMDKGIFSVENFDPLKLPIVLEAGKSIRLLLKIGVTPGKNANNILRSNMKKSKNALTFRAAEKILIAKRIDIYDNAVTPLYWWQGEVGAWEIKKQDHQQIFVVKWRTARGVKISQQLSWYNIGKLN